MTYETAFSVAGLIAMAGWLLLCLSPWIPRWSDTVSGTVLPVVLSLGYVSLLLMPSDAKGGYDSLASVMQLFSTENAMLAGWVHYLAFDLFIGAWICRTARDAGLRFVWVLPCLPLTFLLGRSAFWRFRPPSPGSAGVRRPLPMNVSATGKAWCDQAALAGRRRRRFCPPGRPPGAC